MNASKGERSRAGRQRLGERDGEKEIRKQGHLGLGPQFAKKETSLGLESMETNKTRTSCDVVGSI